MAENEKPKKGVIKRLISAVAFDAAKGLVLFILATVAGVLTPIVAAYFLDTSLGRDPAGAFTWPQFLEDLFDSPPAGTALAFFFGAWWRSAIISSLIGLVVGLLVLIIRYQRRIRTYLRAFAHAENALEMIGFHSIVAGSETQTAWDLLLTDIRDPRTRSISILGASGWETFGQESAPLHAALKEFSGEVRILLVDTKSPHLEKRAASVQTKATDYRKQINDSHSFVADLKGRGNEVELRLYQEPPAWKLIITTNFCWVQYYAKNVHVDKTPVYLFYNSPNAETLYHRFCWEFTRIWSAASPSSTRRRGKN